MHDLKSAVALVLLVFAFSTPSAAESYPSRAVRIVVGGAPGSVPDTMIRPLADRLSTVLAQPVIVDNRPGAAGIIAIEAMLKSAADGYTLALATMSQAVFNRYLFAKLPYDPLRDLAPVAPLATGAMVIAAHPSFPASSLTQLVDMAKRQPAKLFVAMPQTGSPPHIIALLISRAAGIDFTFVPHKSGAEAVSAVVSGEIPLIVDAPTIISPQVKAGRMKALFVTGHERESELPDVPTAAESGLPGVEGEAWIGLVAPKETPSTIIDRINSELSRILGEPDMKATLARLSFRPLIASPAGFAAMMRAEHAKWGPLIRDAGLKLD